MQNYIINGSKISGIYANLEGQRKAGIEVDLYLSSDLLTRITYTITNTYGEWEFTEVSAGEYTIQFHYQGANSDDTITGAEVIPVAVVAHLDDDGNFDGDIYSNGFTDILINSTSKKILHGATELLDFATGKITDNLKTTTGDIGLSTAIDNAELDLDLIIAGTRGSSTGVKSEYLIGNDEVTKLFTVYTSNMVVNSGAPGTTDWVDTNVDGRADDWNQVTANVCIWSIVTGNGFTGNAQRFVENSTYDAAVITTNGIEGLETGETYQLTLKYRASHGLRLHYGTGSVALSAPANTGNAIYYEGEFVHSGAHANMYLGYWAVSGCWVEIDEVTFRKKTDTDRLTDAVKDAEGIALNDQVQNLDTAGELDFNDIKGTAKPEDNATLGATWGTDISNEPTSLNDINTSQYTILTNNDTDLDLIISGTRGAGTGVKAAIIRNQGDTGNMFDTSDQFTASVKTESGIIVNDAVQNLTTGGDLTGNVYDSIGTNLIIDTTNKLLKSANSGNTLIDLNDASSDGKMIGDLHVTGLLTVGVTLTGQRIAQSGSNNTLIFYDPSNNPIITMDDNVYDGLPGLEIGDGVIHLSNTSAPTSDFIFLRSTALTSQISARSHTGAATSIMGQCTHTGDANTTGLYGAAWESSANTYARDRVGIKGYAALSLAGNTSIPIAIFGEAYTANSGVDAIALIGECDDIALQLRQRTDDTDLCDFVIDTDGYLTIDPSGGQIHIDGNLRIQNATTPVDLCDFSVDADSYLTIDPLGGIVDIDGSLRLRNDRSLRFDGTAGGHANQGIQYEDSGSGTRYAMMFPGSDIVAMCNRAANGVVQIRANTATAGSGGEQTIVQVEDDKVDIYQPIINDDIVYPEIITPSGTAAARVIRVDCSDLSDIVSGRISASIRGGFQFWFSVTSFGDPGFYNGGSGFTIVEDNGSIKSPLNGSLIAINDIAITDSSGIFQITINTSNSAAAAAFYLHIEIQGILYSVSTTIYTEP